MPLAEELSRYALGVEYGGISRDTVAEAKRHLIDAVGCGLGALREKPIGMARLALAGVTSNRPATVLGSSARASPDAAAFLDGFMIRYFDFNDTYLSKEPAHPSDNLGAILPVAEAEGRGGRDVLAAMVVAYEVQCRLCDAADLRHRGWDHVNYGLVSTALASSRLMALDAKRSAQAVNIALSGHIAMRQVRAGGLSMWKGASFANAARNGVFAATLARSGVTGPSPIFEGEMGFFRQVSGDFSVDVRAFGGRGRQFRLDRTYLKFWPAEYHAQTAIAAAIALRRRVRSPSSIRSVLVETHEAGYTILGKDPEKWRPATKETADHSLPYMVGMALLHGRVDNSSYSERNLRSATNLRFIAKVRVVEDKGLTKIYPRKGMANRVTLTLSDGTRLTEEARLPRGHPMNPMTEAEVEEKFMGLAGRTLGRTRAKAALEELRGVEACRDIGRLMKSLSA